MPEACGTVMWEEAVAWSFVLLMEVEAKVSEMSLLGSFGSLGVVLNLSGKAVCASRVSYGKKEACGRPRPQLKIVSQIEVKLKSFTQQA